MHRLGSMKNSSLSGTDIASFVTNPKYKRGIVKEVCLAYALGSLLLRLKLSGVLRCAVCLNESHCAHFIFWNFGNWVLCRNGQAIYALSPGPVIRHEYGVRANRAYN